MAEDNVLYVKGMRLSESSEKEEVECDDVWDDSKLTDAYDRALNIANEDVARRFAQCTNSSPEDAKLKNKSKSNQNAKKNNKKNPRWKTGMNCRAVYETDGIEYEALVDRIINDVECVIRFLGYENCEIVNISSLKPSLGNAERTRQIEEALAEKIDNIESLSNNSFQAEKMEYSDQPLSPGSSVSFQRKKKSGNKKVKQVPMKNFELPNPPTPNLAQIRSMGAMDMPVPPPVVLSSGFEDEALSSMLLSWYMSGYYTGLYQGMKRAQKGRKNQ